MTMGSDIETPPTRPYKFKIEQCAKGARVTVHGDEIEHLIRDYALLRSRIEELGFRVAPEE